jgi:hypothetical protein
MNRAAAGCPNCNGPLTFAWPGSVQTVCPHCRSIIVRHNVDLERVGTVSDPPPDTSPIQLSTTGRFDGRTFTVIGRIAYEYDGGTWSEWHVLFEGGRTGWLSDAQLRYAVYERVSEPMALPPAAAIALGTSVGCRDQRFEVVTITDARYRGTEGELPFESWNRELARFADLRSADSSVATIDYTDEPPAFFVGRTVSFDALALGNLRDVDRSKSVPVGALKCAQCAAPLVIRAAGRSQSIVCGSCGSIADATDANVGILQRVTSRAQMAPRIPLGTSGEWHGARYEAVGFQHRTIDVEGVSYGWDEYVLFTPQQGFRNLSEYDGHWTDIAVLDETPRELGVGRRAVHHLPGRTFTLFQSAHAQTAFVLGEFPWVVKVGETAQVEDYVAPPFLLSREGTAAEATWSLGMYVPGEFVWRAFSLEGRPPDTAGVFANQPSPFKEKVGPYWRTFAGLAALVLLAAIFRVFVSGSTVFTGQFHFDPTSQNPAFVTEPFAVAGRTSNVDVSLDTNLTNNWLHVSLALINDETSVALDFDRELEYYFGVEDGESWSTGSRRGGVLVPSVPAGRYYLRVEPDGDPVNRTPVQYSIRVRRDKPVWILYGVAMLLLAIPPVVVTWRHLAFERERWSQSDAHGENDEEDDD